MTRRFNDSRGRRAQAGFTLMELMVVVAIIAMISVFALPRLTKNVAKTKFTDAISGASTLGTQVLAACATRGQLPSQANVQKMLASPPNGIRDFSGSNPAITGACGDFVITLDADDSAGIPDVCVKRVGSDLKFGFPGLGNASATELTIDDLPFKDNKLISSDGTGC